MVRGYVGPHAFCKLYVIRARDCIGFGCDGVNFPESILCSILLLLVVGRVLIIFWLLLSNTPTALGLFLPNSHTIATRLGPGKSLRGHTAGTDNTNCPKGCLISYDFVLSNKSSEERRGRGAVFVLRWWSPKQLLHVLRLHLPRSHWALPGDEVEKESCFVLLLCTTFAFFA